MSDAKYSEQELMDIIKDTVLGSKIIAIDSIYNKLIEDENKFCDSFDIHCKFGCGTCCEHFTPDISQTESDYLAFGMIVENREEEISEKLNAYDPSSKQCPLYNKESPYHCTVYKWRPLICRLFGACASNDKEGNPIFRSCKWNDVRKNMTAKDFEKHPEAVITMKDYGIMMEESKITEPDTELLPYSLPKSIDKIKMMIMFSEMSGEEQN